MKKALLLVLSLLSLSFASSTKVSVTSDNFFASEKEKKSTFSGHVVIKKLSDTIKTDKAIITFDKENKPVKYQAINHITFIITLDASKLEGSCDELIFVPKSKVYTLKGHVNILQTPSNRKIKATKVIIDTKNNKIDITGEKNKPVKFIFEVEDK